MNENTNDNRNGLNSSRQQTERYEKTAGSGAAASFPDGKILLTANEFAQLLGIGRSTLMRYQSSGKIPLPVRIGGSTRWRRKEIEEWVDAGCPSRSRWEAMQKRS